MYINIINNTMFNFSGSVIKNSGSNTIININDNYISLDSNKAVEVLAQTNRGNVSNNLLISNSSLMGTDDYAQSLRLTAKPSQNLIILGKNNPIECIYNIRLDKQEEN